MRRSAVDCDVCGAKDINTEGIVRITVYKEQKGTSNCDVDDFFRMLFEQRDICLTCQNTSLTEILKGLEFRQSMTSKAPVD